MPLLQGSQVSSSEPNSPGLTSPNSAGILCIGDELLSGKVEDLNVRFLTEQLRELGLPLGAVMVMPDVVEVIADALCWLRPQHEVIFTTGGVGPTHDDVTGRAIAMAFQRPLQRSPELEKLIVDLYGGQATDAVRSMADLPEGAVLEYAPGLKVPCVRIENVWVLPGEPTIMRRKFLAIRERFRREPFYLHRIRLRCDEPEIAETLADTARRFPEVAVGSYPRYDPGAAYRVMVTVESKNESKLQAAMEQLSRTIPEKYVIDVE